MNFCVEWMKIIDFRYRNRYGVYVIMFYLELFLGIDGVDEKNMMDDAK